MEVTETISAGVLLIAPKGRLDATTSPEFEKLLQDRLVIHPRLILALKELDYISSAGLRTLLMAAKKIKTSQGKIVLCETNESVRKVLEISGFLSILDLCDTREAAAAAIAT